MWEPLPPRKNNRRSRNQVCNKPEESFCLEDEIARRSRQKKADNSKSTEGCAGEFYEYLDHTADIQLHAWGDTLKEAFAHVIPCMFNYMTDLSTVVEEEGQTVMVQAHGHDLYSLLFSLMDEFLFIFHSEAGFICKRAVVMTFDQDQFTMSVAGYGCKYNSSIHPQGTEIKAITYSNMQIHTPTTISDETRGSSSASSEEVGMGTSSRGRADVYVIVDI